MVPQVGFEPTPLLCNCTERCFLQLPLDYPFNAYKLDSLLSLLLLFTSIWGMVTLMPMTTRE